MTGHFSLADTAALIGEPTRAAMLLALLDGDEHTPTDLARAAELSAPATSLHLAKLVQGGLLLVRSEGRHRYYRLASRDVAHALEALGVIATAAPPVRIVSAERAAVRAARTCYDHLAGAAAVALTERLERAKLLVAIDDATFTVSPRGARWFDEHLAIDVAALTTGRRPLARRCLDWTERRPHLAGALGAAVLECFVRKRWVVRSRSSRAVRIVPGTIDRLDVRCQPARSGETVR